MTNKENNMDPYDDSDLQAKFKARFDESVNSARAIIYEPGTQEMVQDTKTFYQQNQTAILTVVACVVAYKIEKRMVNKVVAKHIAELKNWTLLGDQPV
jgi:hypothetical protein